MIEGKRVNIAIIVNYSYYSAEGFLPPSLLEEMKKKHTHIHTYSHMHIHIHT